MVGCRRRRSSCSTSRSTLSWDGRRFGCRRFLRSTRAGRLVERAVADSSKFLLDALMRFRVGGRLVFTSDGTGLSSGSPSGRVRSGGVRSRD